MTSETSTDTTAIDAEPLSGSNQAGDDRLPTLIKASWGFGAFGVAILMNAIGGLMVYYLTKIVGMEGWIAGVLLSAARLFDAFNDPLIGYLSDRTPERFGGRRRPYLLTGSIACTIAMLLCFNIPLSGSGTLTVFYVAVALVFYGFAYSIFNVPFIAMPAEMTRGYHERSSIHGWRVVFAGSGLAMAGAGSGLILSWLSVAEVNGVQVNTQSDYTQLSFVFAVLVFLSMITAWHGTRHAPVTKRTITQLPWRAQVQSFFGNKPFMTIMLVKALQLIGVYANQTALFFMVVEVMQRSSADIAYIGLPSVFVSILVTPLLLRYAKRFGKRVAYMTAALFASASYVSWIFATPDEPHYMLVIRGVLVGVGFAGNVLFAMSMIADAIEWDSIRTGLHREGMFTAVFSFVEKFAGAIGPTIVGVALSWAGFSATSAVTPESYATLRQATLIGVSYFPAVCATLSVVVLCFYNLSEQSLANARQEAKAAGTLESHS
ncbi:MAG: GPH family glycoside/pentoside/hexuronide:cation symporter [Halieaceae bacterium]|jgi:GPH family glycoside/pentoside/hexuronide:cation symporter